MPSVRAMQPRGWRVMRRMRLAALQQDPYVFGLSYARAAALGKADWQRMITRGIAYLAYPDSGRAKPIGLAIAIELGWLTVELSTIWVRPEARRGRVGLTLMSAVIDWARACECNQVHLWVTETNSAAQQLFERCGFSLTGEREPRPSGTSQADLGMARSL